MLLGVNIDHVATLRQARGTTYPDPLAAALLAESAGADSITIHLREDRRHIQDADVHAIAQGIRTRLNLEMAVTEEMVGIACAVRPADVCLVPEKREELTTEGGLDVIAHHDQVSQACKALRAAGIRASLFIDPEREQIDASRAAGASVIELHTGCYAEASNDIELATELRRIRDAAAYAADCGLIVNAGHGLRLDNVGAIAAVPQIVELNIGHAIVAEAVMVGLAQAVADMKAAMRAGVQSGSAA